LKTAYQKELSAHAKMLLIPGHSRRTKVKAEMDVGSCVRWPYAPHLNEGPKMSMDSLLLPVPSRWEFPEGGPGGRAGVAEDAACPMAAS